MLIIILLYGVGVVQSFHTVIYEYYFVNTPKSWYDAQQYCRAHYTDLATFRNMDDIRSVTRPAYNYAWIGLFDDPASWKEITTDSNSWRWSATGTANTSQYTGWAAGHPDNAGAGEHCVYINGGEWNDYPCNSQLNFACYESTDDSSFKQYVLVQTPLAWEDARSYCRQHHTDLAMIEDESENTAVGSLFWGHAVWIGLYREPWRWSDGTNSSFTNWDTAKGQPNTGWKTCVAENSAQYWHDAPCAFLIPFICLKALTKRVTNVQVKLHSVADLLDPANGALVLAQLSEKLMSHGLTDIKLQWTLRPKKLT